MSPGRACDTLSGVKRAFPDELRADSSGLCWVGADLRPETLIEAYSRGLFPWEGRPPIPWFCPDPRCVLDPRGLRVSRSLAKRARRGDLAVRFDHAFRETMEACATIPRAHEDGTWITPAMVDAYEALHARGVAHSVEVVDGDGALVGGLYGLTLGRFFFGESMFSRVPDGSKLALWGLCRAMADRGLELVDCQVPTRHLLSLGAVPIPRRTYLTALGRTLAHPPLHHPWSDWRVDLAAAPAAGPP